METVVNPTETGTSILNADFWREKRVFLTGHTGFKGSWLAEWLYQLGANVRGYSNLPQWQNPPAGHTLLFEELGLTEKLDHVVGDIRELSTLASSMRAFSPEIVIHMAAQPLVRLSYSEPVDTYATNVMGTVNLLATCRDLPDLRGVVVVTSDKCYENSEQIWGYRESDSMGGHDPYSNSKGCTELVTAAFRSSYFPPECHSDHGVAICSGRAGNVIGGGDWSQDRLVPDVFRAMIDGDCVVIRNPGATRPWQHVLDPLSGYLRLVERSYEDPPTTAAGWNFGPDETVTLSVSEILGRFSERLGSHLQWRADVSHHQHHEAQLLKLDCTAAQVHLGWRPSIGIDQTIDMVTEWYGCEDPCERRTIVSRQIAQVL